MVTAGTWAVACCRVISRKLFKILKAFLLFFFLFFSSSSFFIIVINDLGSALKSLILKVLKMLAWAQWFLFVEVKYDVCFICVKRSLYMRGLFYVFKYLTCAEK